MSHPRSHPDTARTLRKTITLTNSERLNAKSVKVNAHPKVNAPKLWAFTLSFHLEKSIGCSGQFMRGNRKLMALASCAYIGIYVFCADARPRTAVHLTRGFAACDAASTPWHEGRVRIPPMFRCLYICRDLRPASPRRRDRWSPSDARDTNRASPDTNIHEFWLLVNNSPTIPCSVAGFACAEGVRLPDEQREELCEAKSQEAVSRRTQSVRAHEPQRGEVDVRNREGVTKFVYRWIFGCEYRAFILRFKVV